MIQQLSPTIIAEVLREFEAELKQQPSTIHGDVTATFVNGRPTLIRTNKTRQITADAQSRGTYDNHK